MNTVITETEVLDGVAITYVVGEVGETLKEVATRRINELVDEVEWMEDGEYYEGDDEIIMEHHIHHGTEYQWRTA